MSKTRVDDRYSEEETQQRITAAVRGARIVGHKPMKQSKSKRMGKRRTRPKRK
jgi:hypothetical protein